MASETERVHTGTGTANLVIGYLVRQGEDRTQLMANAGLGIDALDPDGRIPRSANQRIWEIAIEQTDDSALGIHIAQFAEPGALGLVEYLARTAGSLVEAIRLASRFERLIHEGITFDIDESSDFVDATHRTRDGAPQLPEAVDFVSASLVCIARQLSGIQVPVQSARLGRPEPDDPGKWLRFFRCPVEFDATSTSLRLDASTANASLSAADSRLQWILRRRAEELEVRLPSTNDFVNRVRAALSETLLTSGGQAADVAKRLGLSERSLRRRLAESGLGHRILRDAVRKERAMELEGSSSQLDIAIELGFANSGAYRRAFRRWTGRSPRAWRKSNTSDDSDDNG